MKKALLVLGLSLGSIACSADSTSELLGGAPIRRNNPVGEGTATDTSPTEASGNAEASPEVDAGTADAASVDAATDAPTDAGDSGSVTPATAFTGSGAYVATTGPSTLKDAHPNGGNPVKADCLSSGCHGAGGAGPRFAAGGSVFTSAAATTPAAQVEVRLRDAAGRAVSAYTDVNGNFFVRAADAATLVFPVEAGARNAVTTRTMSATIANGACNSAACHGSAGTDFIHVP